MRRFIARTWHWPAAAAVLAVGVLAAFAATSRAASPEATTTTAATTTAATTTSATTTAATTTTATTTAATTTQAPPPANASPPAISGTPTQGAVLTASQGTWSGTSPTSYAYQWMRCDATGGSCANVAGQTHQTYTLTSADTGNTVRVAVTAGSASGSTTAISVPTAVIAGTVQTAATGCPSVPVAQTVDVAQVVAPARLQIAAFQPSPSRLTRSMEQFTLRVVVRDTCGHPVRGALVYATAVPFQQVTIPAERATGSDGSVTLAFNRAPRFPASPRQELLAMFLRARQPGVSALGGISTRRLVSLPVVRG